MFGEPFEGGGALESGRVSIEPATGFRPGAAGAVHVVPDRIGALAVTWLEGLAYPAMLIGTSDGALLWTNNRADEFLAQGEVLTRAGGRLSAADRRLRPDLAAFVSGEAADDCWLMPAPDGAPPVLLRKARLDDRAGQPAALLFAYDSGHRDRFAEPDVAALWSLTPTEARVLRLLRDGNPAEQIGRLAGISIETVRTHIRRIYAKMGVSCREELLFNVHQYRVP